MRSRVEHEQGNRAVGKVDLRGIEPLTSSLRTKRATNCANRPQVTILPYLIGAPALEERGCDTASVVGLVIAEPVG